ncbi:MAG: hypothetical protein QXS16_04330 [Pyrobaculum sp.]
MAIRLPIVTEELQFVIKLIDEYVLPQPVKAEVVSSSRLRTVVSFLLKTFDKILLKIFNKKQP